jgi:hypothetical protein
MPFYTQMSLEFVRKTATFGTSFSPVVYFSYVFVNQHVQQNVVLGKMSPFLEHLSVRKGCQQARAFGRQRDVSTQQASAVQPGIGSAQP